MKMLGLLFVLGIGAFGFNYARSLILAPDGIQIGSEAVLPVMEFDEYPFESGIGEMTAGETRTLTLGDDLTFHLGGHCTAELLNPGLYNGNKLRIEHAWLSLDGEAKVIVNNKEASTVNFGNDQIIFACWNTTNFKGERRTRH